jgi:hypothetical protein
VLEASEEIRSYWIHVEAIGNCEQLQLYTLGILRYSGAKSPFLDDPGYASHHSGKVLVEIDPNSSREVRSCANATS